MKTITAKAIAAKAAEQMTKKERGIGTLPVIRAKVCRLADNEPRTLSQNEAKDSGKIAEEVAFSAKDLSMERPVFSARAVIAPKSDDSVIRSSFIPSFQREEEAENDGYDTFPEDFKEEIPMAISKLSKRIGEYIHSEDIFNAIKINIRDKKMYADTFYKRMISAVYHSLMEFCGFVEKIPQNNQMGNQCDFIPPNVILDQSYTNTLIFVERLWNTGAVSRENDNNIVMPKYRRVFSDYDGIQTEWLDFLRSRIKQKIQMNNVGIEVIIDVIKEMWCVTPGTDTSDTADIQRFLSEKCKPNTQSSSEDGIADGTVFTLPSGLSRGHLIPNSDNHHHCPEEYEECENEPDEEDDGDEESDEVEFLSIDVFFEGEGEYDVVKINSEDAFGPISIPIYTNLADISTEDNIPSQASDLNGDWDWLIHMVPDMLFKTRTPEKYLEVNDTPMEEDQMHVVIMDENAGEYTMGIFRLTGIFIVDEDGNRIPCWETGDNDLLAKINKIVKEDIGSTSMTHLPRSLTMTDLIHDEEYITRFIIEPEDDDDCCSHECEHDHGDAPDTSGMSENQLAAYLAITGNDNNNSETDDRTPEALPEEVQVVPAESDVAEETFVIGNPMQRMHVVQPKEMIDDVTNLRSEEAPEQEPVSDSEPEKASEPEPVQTKVRINEAEQVLPGDGILYPVRRKDRQR